MLARWRNYRGMSNHAQDAVPDVFIVKVQVSILTQHTKKQILVYNEDRSIEWTGDLTPDIREHMNGQVKAYFYAIVQGTRVVLGEPAPEQDW